MFVEHVEEINHIVQFCARPCNAQKSENRHLQKCARWNPLRVFNISHNVQLEITTIQYIGVWY